MENKYIALDTLFDNLEAHLLKYKNVVKEFEAKYRIVMRVNKRNTYLRREVLEGPVLTYAIVTVGGELVPDDCHLIEFTGRAKESVIEYAQKLAAGCLASTGDGFSNDNAMLQ